MRTKSVILIFTVNLIKLLSSQDVNNFSCTERVWKTLCVQECESKKSELEECFQDGDEGLCYCMCERLRYESLTLPNASGNGLWRIMLRNNSNLKNIKVTDVFWIGAHNAGSDKLSFLCDKNRKFYVDKFSNSACKWASFFSSLSIGRNLARFISKSQIYDIQDLLKMGVRFFDIDLCVDNDFNLRTCHCLFGRRISTIFLQIKRWLIFNPDEILVFRFADGVNKAIVHDMLRVALSAYLQKYLVPSYMWHDDLNKLQSEDKRVFVIVRNRYTSEFEQFEDSVTTGGYSDLSDIKTVVNDQLKKSSEYKWDTLNILHAYKTVNWIDVLRLFVQGEQSLSQHLSTNQKFYDHILSAKSNAFMYKLNVIMLDNIDVNFVKKLKGVKATIDVIL